jgi:hypothetical protein
MRGTLTCIVNFAHALGGGAFLTAALASTTFAQAPAPRRESQVRRATTTETTRPSSSASEGSRVRTRDSQTTRAASDDASADLSITAHVTADSLRFEKVPNPRVEFTGRPKRETIWEAQRENLPQEVQPGVTYRDIGITLRITSVFANIDRIVAEALGEVPTSSDDAQPVTTQPSPAPPTQPGADNPGTPSTISNASTLHLNADATTPRRSHTHRGRAK